MEYQEIPQFILEIVKTLVLRTLRSIVSTERGLLALLCSELEGRKVDHPKTEGDQNFENPENRNFQAAPVPERSFRARTIGYSFDLPGTPRDILVRARAQETPKRTR